MKRAAKIAILLFWCFGSAVHAQDRVDYLDPAKNHQKTSKSGTISSEDPARLVLLTGANRTKLEIPAAAVVDVVYDKEPGEMVQGRAVERGKDKDFDKRLAIYRDALKKAPKGEKYLQAHVRFKVAKLLAQQALGDKDSRPAAIEELRKFAKEFPDGRQIVECYELISQLLVADGSSTNEVIDGYRKLKAKYGDKYEDLAARVDLFEGRIRVQEAEILADKPEEAKKKYTAARSLLAKMLANADPATAADVKILLADCNAHLDKPADALKDLDAVLTGSTEPRIRAAAHLTRGDCLRLQQKYRDALWDYLWVDVVYNEDREQQARAVFHMIEVFDALKEDPAAKDRARDCRERLRLEERLQDTRYQRRFLAQSN